MEGCRTEVKKQYAVASPRRRRSIAVATLLMHAFGDVPSPIAVGLLKDRWAPDCAPDARSRIGEACGGGSKQRGHLRAITFGLCLYFLTSLVFFGVARWRAARRAPRR